MALFHLDPKSIAARVRATGVPSRPPTLGASVLRGSIGFTLVSVAAFAPWPIFDRWLRGMTEMDLYLACAAIFIGLSGLFLHRLILGPGSLSRFYKLFSLGFAAYAITWVVFWVWLRGDLGVIAGLLGGAVAMGAILAFAFDARRAIAQIVAALFVLNALGYYLGGWIAGKFGHSVAAMLLWGAFYGVGFGAGLGLAFHVCQADARAILRESHGGTA
ncbi:MAG: hypothetical protein QOE70_76 [Chthoniobacter sp.]|jgi:hypothetical protein|nr:hypothetical protein [Chthoniobacter sp.]